MELDTTDATQNSGVRSLLQEIAVHLGTPDIDEAEEAAARFDVSPFRLWLLFKAADTNDDGFISKNELISCLMKTEDMNASQLIIQPLEQLWNLLTGAVTSTGENDTVAESDSGRTAELRMGQCISYPQFCRLIRYLWLMQLLNSEFDDDWRTYGYTFDCIDYSPANFEQKEIPGHINTESTHFFLVRRQPFAKMRWIDIPSGSHRAARITILRLSVKYRFHPTSIEDAIDLEIQAPKVNAFENSLLGLGDYGMDSITWLKDGDEQTRGCYDVYPCYGEKNVAGIPISMPKRMSTKSNFDASSSVSDLSRNPVIYEVDVTNEDGMHYFIVVPMFELTQRSYECLQEFQKLRKEQEQVVGKSSDEVRECGLLDSKPLIIEVVEAALGIFVASAPNYDLVVTVSTKWKPTRIKPAAYALDTTNAGENEEKAKEPPLKDTKCSLVRVKNLLQKRHSILRHGNSNWLMHAVIDALVDQLNPICMIYEAQLQRMAARLLVLGHKLKEGEVKDMIVMKRDLEWLQHELRPLQRVIQHLIDDRNIGAEVTHYLEDVEDHLRQCLDELATYARECESLKDEYNTYLDRRTNDILYLLTLVTTMAVPAQLLTGYFGMNFINNDTEELGSPLLNLGGVGLACFWAITAACTITVAAVMHRYKWFER